MIKPMNAYHDVKHSVGPAAGQKLLHLGRINAAIFADLQSLEPLDLSQAHADKLEAQ